ncbi:cytochrome P450 [Saccharopolyspora subtropica]|uniref:Cytochrome P450 n=1 Tax=Saccharopolyspora thermophila TaxID=89367 RepID=A0A917JKN8_9PSEU|nr:cytochrome P450 [Saccharopolyspora subtropica]GGI73495.1 cytochrome P450 [Saccharopolyspora subtropica]
MTASATGEIFRPLSPEMLADPYRVYAQLRATDPVRWHEQLRSWVLTRHDDCVRVLRDPACFGSDPRALGLPIPDSVISLQTMDPPEHPAVRHYFVRALRGRDLDRWAVEVRRIADELLRRASTFDFVDDVAEPLALQAMCLLCEVPYPDDDRPLREASRTMVLGMDSGLDPRRREPALAAREVLNDIVARWVSTARSGMFAGLADITSIDHRYLVNSAKAVFDAGYSSTSNMLGNVMHQLVRRGPLKTSQVRGIDADGVAELGRLDPVVQAVSRFCLADVELRGRRLRRGDVVIAMLGAANHDPAVFPDPAEPDLTRAAGPSLLYGRGAHSCLGGHLANRIGVVLLHAMADAFDRVELAGPVRQRPTATQRGLDELPLRAG